MRTGAGTVRVVAIAAASVVAAMIGVVVGAPPAAAETVQLVLDCQAGGQVVQYTLPFASRASAWVPEGGTATMSVDSVVQTLPDVAPPPLPEVPIDHYEDVILELSATGGTITDASFSGLGSNLGPGDPTVTFTATSVTMSIPGPVAAGEPFTPPPFTVDLAATAPAGGEVRLVPAAAFYRATAFRPGNSEPGPVICYPQDPSLATTTVPVIAPSSPPAPPLPPPPPPSAPEPPSEPAPPVVGVGELVPLAPQRLLDTRDGTGAPAGPVAAGSSITVAARGLAGIPADASAVILNVTATEPQGDGFVTVYPCGGAVPVVSNVNYQAGDNVPNLVTVPLASDGTVCLFTFAAADLVADVSGAVVSAGDLYTGTSPVRLVDTRDGTGTGAGPLEVGQQLVVPIAGMAGAPGDASAAVANLTVSEPVAAGFLSAFPCGQSPPNSSNLNFVAGQTVSNLAFTSLGPSGSLCITASAETQVVVDLAGWTAPAGGATLALVTPTRVVDTRTDGTRLAANATLEVDTADLGAPSTTTALVANVTAVNPAAPGYLSVYPCGQAPPNSSNVNYAAGETRPVLVFAALGANGRVCITSYAAADVLVDLQGWFVTL